MKIKNLIISALISGISMVSISANTEMYNKNLSDKQFLGNYIFDTNVNNEELSVGFKYDLSAANSSFKKGMSYVGVNYFKVSKYEDTKNDIIEANILIKDFINMVPGFKIGVGLKLLHTSYEDKSVNKSLSYNAMPFGIEAEYFLPVGGDVPVSISAKGYYAPNPLTMSDAYLYYEYGTQVNAKLLNHVNAYLGYRSVNTSYEKIGKESKKNINLNSSVYFGVSIGF